MASGLTRALICLAKRVVMKAAMSCAGTGFPDGFADLDAVFETGLAGARLGVGLECAALDDDLALEEAARSVLGADSGWTTKFVSR